MEDKAGGNAAVETAESNAPAKKTSKSKAKSQQQQQQQQKKVSSRPPTSEMVTAAIKELKDRKGSSFQAIKKYIVSTYKVDGEKVTPFIKRYLKTAVSAGAVVQTKGKGATGSFKLSTEKVKPKSKGKAQRAPAQSDALKAASKKDVRVEKIARKPAAAKKAAPAKKAAESPKRQLAQKAAAKAAVGKKSKAAAEPKSPSKAKKAVKAPAAKTKTPKPKKATAKTVKAAKK